MLRLICSFCTFIAPFSKVEPWNWKDGWDWSRWTCFGVGVPKTLELKLKSALMAPYDHNTRPSQTNVMAIAPRFVLTNAKRAEN